MVWHSAEKEWKLQWGNITSEKNYGTYNDNLLL